ncbi:serine/arginine repetitive matrix protein 3-like [Lynx rufus]|uniref:serine/arginine repetitive matrix protein 3-like n=1 Tax=Lynx rufus TaxID=61384 RepID=UPI001F12339D|nr:serine/arginine repetitive matrix protein 3-like [Lynx rufus]
MRDRRSWGRQHRAASEQPRRRDGQTRPRGAAPARAPSCCRRHRRRRGRARVHPGRGDARNGQEFPPSARPPAGLSRPPAPLLLPSRTRAARGGRRGRAAAARGGGKGEQEEERPRREARSSCSRKSPPSFPPCKCGDGGGSCETKRRFSSATRRSYNVRHEQEETAAARRLLGQYAPAALEQSRRLAPPILDAPGWGGASGAQSQCAAQRARPAPSSLSPGGEKTSDGFCELAGILGGGEAL